MSAAKRPPGRGVLAAGAARATGERARRRSTPLIGDGAANPQEPLTTETAGVRTGSDAPGAVTDAPVPAPGPSTQSVHRPVPKAVTVPSRKAVTRSGTRPTDRRSKASERSAVGHPLRAVPDVPPPPPPPPPRAAEGPQAPGAQPDTASASERLAPAVSATRVTPGLQEMVKAAIAALRLTAQASGLSPEEVERQVAATLAVVRRRLSGDYSVDEFGFDEDFTEHLYLPLLRPLYKTWFRVEVKGLENIPAEGGALVVANHSGTVAMDALMTQVAVHDEHPSHRHLRMLGADLVFSTPVVGQIARKSGSTLAANSDAERLLGAGEVVGVWPEGFKGVGKPFSERYKLQRFGRGGFVSAALRTGVPIVPCSIVGAEEIYPILGNMGLVARVLGMPYAPITPTWPLLGPLGLVPLPSKWIIEFGAAVDTASLGPGAADDPMLVFDLTDQVRETIQQTLYSLLMQRRSVFS